MPQRPDSLPLADNHPGVEPGSVRDGGVLVLFGLGANLGDREAVLAEAARRLRAVCPDLVCSAYYETPPWGDLDQPAFLNQAARGTTTKSPEDVLKWVKELERGLGRVPTRHWGPRVVDVDILAHGDVQMHTATLTLPHPFLHQRGFVLLPLAEIAAEWRHPALGRTVAELIQDLPTGATDGIVRLDPHGGRAATGNENAVFVLGAVPSATDGPVRLEGVPGATDGPARLEGVRCATDGIGGLAGTQGGAGEAAR